MFVENRKIAISGLTIAIYVILMYFTQSFAFGQYQIRLATSIYALAYIHPFLMILLGLANMLSNILMGGLGMLDIIGGFLVGVTTSYIIVLIKKYNFDYRLVFFPIFLIIPLMVSSWLYVLLGLSYWGLVFNIAIGQFIPAILGVFIIKRLR